MRQSERRERGEIWSEDGREMDEREMEGERKNQWRLVTKLKGRAHLDQFGLYPIPFYCCLYPCQRQ
jgi:hypothetical protein